MNHPAPKVTRRTPICMLAVACAMSLVPARPLAADTQEAVRERGQSTVLRVGAKRELKHPSAAAEIARFDAALVLPTPPLPLTIATI